MSPEAARDTGVKRASTRADRKVSDWSKDAYSALALYIDAYPSREFMAEDVRAWAETGLGLQPPPDPRAWGGIMQRANRAKLLAHMGYRPSGNARAHLRPTAVWKRA